MKESILEVVHESVKGLYDSGLIDAATMHEFNALCLPPVEINKGKTWTGLKNT